jgi:hypothetical protein
MTIGEATQIVKHASKGEPMAIPSIEEAKQLLNQVKNGDVFAIERVTKLWHNMTVSNARNGADGLAVRIIFEAYLGYVKKELEGVTEEF